MADTRCHAIDRDLGIMVENAFQPLPPLLHCREGLGAEFDAFAVPNHPPGGFEREIGPGFDEYRHDPVPYR